MTTANLKNCDNSTSFSVGAGIKANDNFALELSYLDLGDSDDGIPPVWTITANGFTLTAMGIAPVNDNFSVYANAGMFKWDFEVDEEGTGQIYEKDGSDAIYGVGFEYVQNQQFGLNFELLKTEIDNEDVDNLSVGARFYF